MRLKKFRVRKYKRIDDSGDISVEDLTGFVGKNEAGKSSIFEALAKLHSSTDMQFDPEQDIPHLEYLKLSKNTASIFPIEATFELEEGEKIKGVPNEFVIKKYYNNKYHVEETVTRNIITNNIDFDDLMEKLPSFIYFDEYDALESTFDIPVFIEKFQANKEDHDIRTQRCIFEYVGLTPELFNDLNFDDQQNLTFEEKNIEWKNVILIVCLHLFK